jgi:hypothetical protein
MWLTLWPALVFAGDPSLMTLGQTPGMCDDVAALSAAKAFHVTLLASDVTAALLVIVLWRFLERREIFGGTVRFIVTALVAAAIAAALVTWNPTATDTQKVMMANMACQHHFWLGSAGPLARGVVLGALPAAALSVIFNLGVRLVTNRA